MIITTTDNTTTNHELQRKAGKPITLDLLYST